MDAGERRIAVTRVRHVKRGGVCILELNGKTAVITGAAKGIGRRVAQTFAEAGARVCILDYDINAGEEAARELADSGYGTLFVQTDVSDYQSLLDAKKEVLRVFGRPELLIVNAGISVRHSFGDITPEEWKRVIDINLNGSFYTCKAFFDGFNAMSPGDGGKIVFITSGSGITGTGGGAHYAASKSGQHGLMRALAKELGKNGVNVNAIAPRVIVTDIFDMLYPTEEAKQTLIGQIPIGRFGLPEDVAGLALFLCCSKASYMHGQIVLLDGGRTY